MNAAGCPAGMQDDHIRSNHLRDRCLMLQLLNRRPYHRFALRVEHYELIGVQAQPDIVGARDGAGPPEGAGDRSRWVESLQVVAGDRMGGERKDLTAESERSDAELVAPLESGYQGI